MDFRHTVALLAVPALFLGAPLAATMPGTGTNSDDQATSETSPNDPNRVVCKRNKVSGSRLTAKKVCMTAAEWERQRREDQQLAEKVQNSRSTSGGN